MSKPTHYKVWVHIEGLNAEGDIIEGDENHEPREAGCFATSEDAVDFQNELLDFAHENNTEGLIEDPTEEG